MSALQLDFLSAISKSWKQNMKLKLEHGKDKVRTWRKKGIPYSDRSSRFRSDRGDGEIDKDDEDEENGGEGGVGVPEYRWHRQKKDLISDCDYTYTFLFLT